MKRAGRDSHSAARATRPVLSASLERITVAHSGELPGLERPDDTAAVIDRSIGSRLVALAM